VDFNGKFIVVCLRMSLTSEISLPVNAGLALVDWTMEGLGFTSVRYAQDRSTESPVELS
jgi:hypothetical protein